MIVMYIFIRSSILHNKTKHSYTNYLNDIKPLCHETYTCTRINKLQFNPTSMRWRNFKCTCILVCTCINTYVPVHYMYLSVHYLSVHYLSVHYLSVHYLSVHYLSVHYLSVHYLSVHYLSVHYLSVHYLSVHYLSVHYLSVHILNIIQTNKDD